MIKNSLMVIAPYRYEGMWVFDDERVGLTREPFVAGIPEMIDALTAGFDTDDGFRLIFSAEPWAGSEWSLSRAEPEYDGYWYVLDGTEFKGWLCPAMFRYFETAPAKIYFTAVPAP